MTVDQQTAQYAAEFWLECARREPTPSLKEDHVQRAIRNLMVASYGR